MSVLPELDPAERPAPALVVPDAAAGTVDFDLHGFVGIRLVGASAGDAAAVERQIGPIRAPLTREPDIVVRFVDRLAGDGERLLGVDDAAHTKDAFLVLRGRRKTRTRVQIPLDRVGGRCEVVCETGAAAVPLLIGIVNLTALAKGVLPLHAAAFEHRGRGVLVTGWAKGGKTESLLGFMAQGARYIGDEWVYISADGSRLYGIPEPISLWDWHLDDLPQHRALVPAHRRAAMRLARLAIRVDGMDLGAATPLRRVMPLVERRARVDVGPHDLFGAEACSSEGPFDTLLLVGNHTTSEVTVRRIDADEVARRMVFSLMYERLDLLEAYLKFRFAFPDRRNPLIEDAESLQRDALHRVLAGKDAYEVMHPYPAPIPALHAAMAAVV